MTISADEAKQLLTQMDAEEKQSNGPERSVKNVARATGQRLQSTALGVGSAALGIAGEADVLLSQLGETLGLAKEGAAKEARGRASRIRDSIQSKASNKTQFGVAETITDLAAKSIPATRLGGLVAKTAKAGMAAKGGLVGSSRGARVVAEGLGGATSGAAVAGFSDPGEGGSRTQNASMGALLGGAFGGLIGGRMETSGKAVRAFEQTKTVDGLKGSTVTPTLSQVAKSDFAKGVGKAIEQTTAKMGVVGIRGAVRRQERNVGKFVKKVFKDLDNSAGKKEAISGQFDELFTSLDKSKAVSKFPASAKQAEQYLQMLKKTEDILPIPKSVVNTLDKLRAGKAIPLSEGQMTRRAIGDQIGKYKAARTTTTASKGQLKALSEIKATLTKEVEKGVAKAGKGTKYADLNKEFALRTATDDVGQLIKDAAPNDMLNPGRLAELLGKYVTKKGVTDETVLNAVKGMKFVGDKFAKLKLKSTQGLNLNDLLGGAAAGGAGAGLAAAGAPGAGIVGGLAAATFAMGKLVSTRTGMTLISDIGRKGLTPNLLNMLIESIPAIAGATIADATKPEIDAEEATRLLQEMDEEQQ